MHTTNDEIKAKRAARIKRWKGLADSYANTCERTIAVTDGIAYPLQIMSVLSDAQRVLGLDSDSDGNDLLNAAKVMLSRMIDMAQQRERDVTAVHIGPHAKAEALLTAFFPSTRGERGFYATFDPAPTATVIAPTSAEGRILLRVLGLQFNPNLPETDDHVGYFMYGTEWASVTPTLLRIDKKIFAGYWDGDGTAILSDGEGFWYETNDVKCDYDWNEFTNKQIDGRVASAAP